LLLLFKDQDLLSLSVSLSLRLDTYR